MPDQPTLPPPGADSDLTIAPSLPDPYATLSPGEGATAGPGGERLPGYELLGELGRGGMGVVYKARQIKLNRVVALKMILGGAHADEAGRQRFRAEAEAIAALQHPNIVDVYDVGEHDGHPYFSLEFCAGGSLEKRLAGTPLPPRDAAALVATLARAMQAAHDAGVVHRDLKPANVLLTLGERGVLTPRSGASPPPGDSRPPLAQDVPKITDFGLARRLDQDSNQTRTGAIVGTPSYMAPEQAGGKKDVGPACDVWALGAILYECVTGRPPFRAATALDTVLQVVNDEPAPPSRLNAGAPRDLETIALKCLQKEPKKRYASAAELADDLGRYLADEPIRARPVGAAERVAKWVRRHPAVSALLLLALTLTAAGVGGVFYEWRQAQVQRDEAEKQRDLARRASREASERAEAEALAVKEATAARAQAEDRRLAAEKALRDARGGLYFYDVLRAQRDLKAGLPDRAAAMLENCPLDLRGWEWHYLSKLCRPDFVPCLGHTTDAAWALGWTPDGKTLASGGTDGTVRLWDPATGLETRRVEAHKGAWVNNVEFSPDGRWLATASMLFTQANFARLADWEKSFAGEVKLWDTATWREVRTFPGQFSARFSPDGQRLVFPAGRYVHVADVRTGRLLATMLGHTLPVSGAEFTADGRKVISWGKDEYKIDLSAWGHPAPIRDIRGELKVWDAATGRPAGPPLEQPASAVYGATRHRDGRRFGGVSLNGAVTVWDLRTGKTSLTLAPREARASSFAFTPDDGLVVSYLDSQAIVHRLDTGARTRTILGPGDGATLSPDGKRLATAAGGGRPVRIFDLGREDPSRHLDLPGPVGGCAFGPDGERLAVLSPADQTLRLIDAKSMKEIARAPTLAIRLAWSRDGRRLVVGGHRPPGFFKFAELSVRDPATGKELFPLKGPGQMVVSLDLSADGRWLVSAAGTVAGKQPGSVSVWDLDKGAAASPRPIPTRNVDVLGVAVSPDGRLVAGACRDRVTRVWDRESGKLLWERTGHDIAVKSVAFRPDGQQLASGGFDGTVVLWDVATGEKQRELRGHQRAATATDAGIVTLAYSRDGRRLASASFHDGSHGEVKVWDPETGVEAYSLDGKIAVAFSPDGSRLAAGAGGTGGQPWQLRVWDATPRPEVAARLGHAGPIRAVSASRDGKRFATASSDGTARVWSAVTGELLLTLAGRHRGQVWHAAFSPDGTRLATAGDDRAVRVWRLDTGAEERALTGHSRRVRQIAWLDDGRLASAGEDKLVLVWDVRDGRVLHRLPQSDSALSLAVSPDGRRLAVGESGVRMYDAASGKELYFVADKSSVHSLAFRPDGERLATGDYGGWVRVLDSATGKQTSQAGPAGGAVYAVGWSADGALLAAVGEDRQVRVYDFAKDRQVLSLSGHMAWVPGLACLADGLIATGDGRGEVRLWRFPRAAKAP